MVLWICMKAVIKYTVRNVCWCITVSWILRVVANTSSECFCHRIVQEDFLLPLLSKW